MTPPRPLRVVLWSLRREARPLCLYQMWMWSFRSKVTVVPKFRNWGTWPRPCPFRGCYIFHTQAGSVLQFYTKFETDSSFRWKVITGSQISPRRSPSSPGVQNSQNLISWRWSLPLPTNPVWCGSINAISSYRGNRPTNTRHWIQTNTLHTQCCSTVQLLVKTCSNDVYT